MHNDGTNSNGLQVYRKQNAFDDLDMRYLADSSKSNKTSTKHKNVPQKAKGRELCNCQARDHKLVNNCLSCGRVVCAQEGSGPCLFCGELVCTEEELDILLTGSKKKVHELKGKLYGSLLSDVASASVFDSGNGKSSVFTNLSRDFENALVARDRLLEYDQTSTQRTKVIDDEHDYFGHDSPWLTNQERNRLRDKLQHIQAEKALPRSQQKLTLDFAGRQTVHDKPNYERPEDSMVYDEVTDDYYDAEPTHELKRDANQQFVSKNNQVSESGSGHTSAFSKMIPRLQDSQLQTLADEGWCLSMHQPWASLLVEGIKQHEGRTWYTGHRGRLWIASTSRQANEHEMKEIEQFYRIHYQRDNVPFPTRYLTSALLGCVDVADCLTQERYRELFPLGESNSPYVLICENPRPIRMVFPIKGKHKIYKLDGNILAAAKKNIGSVIEPFLTASS